LVFIFSCTLPVYITESDGEYDGIYALLVGWIQVIHNPVFLVCWFANILYIVSMICGFFRRLYIFNILVCVVALFFCLMAFLPETIMTDEAGGISKIKSGLGIYVWIFAMMLMMIRAMIPFGTAEEIFKKKEKELSVDDFK